MNVNEVDKIATYEVASLYFGPSAALWIPNGRRSVRLRLAAAVLAPCHLDRAIPFDAFLTA